MMTHNYTLEKCLVCNNKLHLFEKAKKNKDSSKIFTLHISEECHSIHNLSSAERKPERINSENSVYNFLDSNKVSEEIAKRKNLAKSLISECKNFFSVIDFGAGPGFLSIAFSEYFTKVYSVDMNTDLQKKVKNTNLIPQNVIYDNNLDNVKDKSDLIVMWHVLEHLYDPVGQLKELKSRLTEDGCIYAQVPLYKNKYLADDHVVFYNAKSIEFLINKVNMKIIKLNFDLNLSFLTVCFKKGR